MRQNTGLRNRDDLNKPDPHQYGKQAYSCSHDARFIKFASEQEPNATMEFVHDAAQFIAKRCGVQAPRFIDDSPEAIAKWQELYDQFRNTNGSDT